PNRQRRLAECEVLRKRFKTVRLVHVKRDFNQAADYLTSKTLALGESWMVQDDEEIRHLEVVSRIQEQRTKRPEVVQDAEVGVQKVNDEEVLTSDVPEPDLGACPESNILNPECAPLLPAARVMAVLTRAAAQADAQGRPPMGPLEYQV
ncbi:hypothetical protein F441_14658, partial [Phytophthora nicotianae CJ01A1]